MDREMHKLRTENNCLRTFTTGVDPTATGTRQNSLPSLVKIFKPTKFKGSHKDSIEINRFLLQCNLYFSDFSISPKPRRLPLYFSTTAKALQGNGLNPSSDGIC